MAFNDGIHVKPEKLKKKELLALRNAYPSGKKVVAIFVDGVKRGKVGKIEEVKDNGDILVVWEDGRKSCVKHLMESVRVLGLTGCMLGHKRGDGQEYCEEGLACESCGWNYEVAEKRIERIRTGSMVEDKEGKLRLFV